MHRVLALIALLAALVFGTGPASPRVGTSRPQSTRLPSIVADPVATGLNFPAAFTFAPDGRIFYGQRTTGKIRVFDPATGSDTLFFTVTDLSHQGEQGLLGLALHPGYPAQPFVYAYATRKVNGTLRNQILRIKDTGGVGSNRTIIFSSDTVAGTYHDGGRILFGPDGQLYAAVGEGHDSSNSQNFHNNAGKLLRMTPTGKVPQDNPFPGKLIFTYGLRNSYGFTFDPQTGLLWQTENGPQCNDEINLEQPGENHGWGPTQTCSVPPPAPLNTNQDGPNRVLPLAWFSPTIAPTGAAFCDGCGLAGYEGTMLFGCYNTSEIRQVVLTPDRKHVASVTTVFDAPKAVLSVERGPDGTLYFSDVTSIYSLAQS